MGTDEVRVVAPCPLLQIQGNGTFCFEPIAWPREELHVGCRFDVLCIVEDAWVGSFYGWSGDVDCLDEFDEMRVPVLACPVALDRWNAL